MDLNEIARLCESLSIKSKEEKIWGVNENLKAVAGKKLEFCLVGKILSYKHINGEAFRAVIPRIWRTQGLEIELNSMGDIRDFLGRLIGDLIDIDVGSIEECFKKYMRVRVGIDVSKPLKRFLRMDLSGNGEESLLLLRYEKLPEYCFCYGMVGYSYSECRLWLKDGVRGVDTNFDFRPRMRASNPLGNHKTGVGYQPMRGESYARSTRGSFSSRSNEWRTRHGRDTTYDSGLKEAGLKEGVQTNCPIMSSSEEVEGSKTRDVGMRDTTSAEIVGKETVVSRVICVSTLLHGSVHGSVMGPVSSKGFDASGDRNVGMCKADKSDRNPKNLAGEIGPKKGRWKNWARVGGRGSNEMGGEIHLPNKRTSDNLDLVESSIGKKLKNSNVFDTSSIEISTSRKGSPACRTK
ncbi:hypothetical protein EZV62_001194 [Acer yangbiense]|uniref:Zinc knuckle CX2CX4HX4C domain-containing protein n=1 Tax=Acer yangbiense TaxID=1000413 RepID=A0A5C7ITS2_9ROSI|nr:hypothetical protein EZV62_001194 [Acer yangbiense]